MDEKASVSLATAYRLGGRIELGEWIDLSVEGARTAQVGGANTEAPSTVAWGGNRPL